MVLSTAVPSGVDKETTIDFKTGRNTQTLLHISLINFWFLKSEIQAFKKRTSIFSLEKCENESDEKQVTIFVLVTQYQGQFKIQTMEAIKYKLFQDDISLKPK